MNKFKFESKIEGEYIDVKVEYNHRTKKTEMSIFIDSERLLKFFKDKEIVDYEIIASAGIKNIIAPYFPEEKKLDDYDVANYKKYAQYGDIQFESLINAYAGCLYRGLLYKILKGELKDIDLYKEVDLEKIKEKAPTNFIEIMQKLIHDEEFRDFLGLDNSGVFVKYPGADRYIQELISRINN